MSTTTKKKSRVNEYADSIKKSYRTGYMRGYNDAKFYGSKFGESFAGATGYYRGVKEKKQSEKIQKKAKTYY